jgi:23S rRNA (cytosine1962-C5)-methyltransferase
VDADFLARRLARAIAARTAYEAESNALRLVNAESDGLPGLVVDRYADTLVCQFLSAGAEFWRETIVEQLVDSTGCKTVYERSDVEVRSLEGLAAREGALRGTAPEGTVQIVEHEMQFKVDVAEGHKTGFYLDQRRNRLRVRELAEGREVLDCFSYTGGFAANALQGGAAAVTLVESSADALALAGENLALNGFPADRAELLEADVFGALRGFRDQARAFDLIILDPPKFAEARSQLMRASRGYKDINRLALKLLRPGGLLFTFSCSGLMNVELFQKIVADGAIDAGCDVQMLQWLGQSPDHPVKLHIPESMYLKGLIGKKLA